VLVWSLLASEKGHRSMTHLRVSSNIGEYKWESEKRKSVEVISFLIAGGFACRRCCCVDKSIVQKGFDTKTSSSNN